MLRCIVLVAIAVTAADCDMYTCKPSSMTWDGSTCGYYNTTDTTWYFQYTCDSGQVCTQASSTDLKSNYTCSTPSNPSSTTIYPGEKCGDGYTCSNNNATYTCGSGDVCLGQALNDTCKGTNKVCAPTLFCNTTDTANPVCSSQLSAGMNCTADLECQNNLGCFFNNTSADSGVCTPYFSLSAGELLNAADLKPVPGVANSSYYCENLSAFVNDTANNLYICLDPVTMMSANPVNCTANSDCVSNTISSINATVETECLCGQNPTGTQYCALQPGDAPASDALAKLKQWVMSSDFINKCSSVVGPVPGVCAMNYWGSDYTDFQYYSAWASAYPMIQGSEDCVLETVQSAYYQLKKEEDFALALVVAGLIGLAI